MQIIKKILYDTSLPTISKMVGLSTLIGCLPGTYMCLYADKFELISNSFWMTKAYSFFSFGIFLIMPLSLFLVGLIPSRLVRYSLSFANAIQLKLFSFIYAVTTYADIIKSTPYFDIVYKYSVAEKFSMLKALNIKQASAASVPPLPDMILEHIAITQTTMAEVKSHYLQSFDVYLTVIRNEVEKQVIADASWIPIFKTIGYTVIEWAPYIVSATIILIIGYKINAFFTVPSELSLVTSDGIRIQQRVDMLSTQVSGLASEQARLAEVVRNTHSALTTTVLQTSATNQGVVSLSDSMLTHSQLLNGVIQILVTNPEFMEATRRLQGVNNLPQLLH